MSLNTTADGLETVSNLQPLTNYTCCISANNQAGEGNDTCVNARTKQGMLVTICNALQGHYEMIFPLQNNHQHNLAATW